MLDIIGIGSLNLDLIATAEKIEALPPEKIREIKKKLEYGAEGPVDLSELENIRSLLGPASFRAVLGGSAFNTIHTIAALNSGLKTGYVGVAGPAGNSGLNFLELMQELAVDNKYVAVCTDQDSGLCICINHEGARSLLYHPGCNTRMADYLEANYQEILQYLTETRILHITSFIDDRTPIILARIIREAKRKNPAIKISCDPGYFWLKDLAPAVAGIIKIADFLFLNRTEYNLLGGGIPESTDLERARRIFARYELRETLLILKDKSYTNLYTRSGQDPVEQSFKINAVKREQISDFTGAGDTLAAGFLTVLLIKERALPQAAELGNRFMRTKLTTPPEQLYPELARIFSQFVS
jgi:sugar/nucleoside kinase (ribokinase family)